MFLTDKYMTSLCKNILSDIRKIQYKTGDMWYDGAIRTFSSGAGTIKIGIVISNIAAMVIKGIRFVDSEGETVAELSENITKKYGDIFSATFNIIITERNENS